MRHWFHQHYTDPVENTPYESAEGGYIYIWGGPYDPREELEDEFSGVAREIAIEELAEELREITWEWTGNSDEQAVDDYFFETIARSTPALAYHASILNIERLIDARVDADVQQILLRLLYANVVTALEIYLSDVFISKINSSSDLLRSFVEKNKDFHGEKFPISQVFRVRDEIEQKVKTYLTELVWHRLDKVKPLFEDVLLIDFPLDLKDLFKAIIIRHDIVHRNGKTPEGVERTITKEEIAALIGTVNQFVDHIETWEPPAPERPVKI
jgi:hypothetical protein